MEWKTMRNIFKQAIEAKGPAHSELSEKFFLALDQLAAEVERIKPELSQPPQEKTTVRTKTRP